VHDLPVTATLGQIAPRNTRSIFVKNGFHEPLSRDPFGVANLCNSRHRRSEKLCSWWSPFERRRRQRRTPSDARRLQA
jgi:hypothetical protein